jgi:type IV pilus assembly protein PilP
MIRILLIFMLLFPFYGCKEKAPKPQPQAQKVRPSEAKREQAAPQVEEKKVEAETYTYNPSGRKDPFLSIIEATKKEKEVEKKKKVSKPTEAFDVNDIKIIAIAWEGDRYYAMVRLPDGKFFTLKEGMTIGLYGGKVVKIDSNTVVVREFIKDYKGDIKPRDTILKLRKEEGE